MGYFSETYDAVYSTQVLNEIYFGKTKEVLAIEKAIHDLRAPYVSDVPSYRNLDSYVGRMNTDPNKQKLAKAICDAFGFQDASLWIIESMSSNAGTISTSGSIDLGSEKLARSAKSASSRRSGYKFDKADGIVFFCEIYSSLLSNSMYSDAEVTAVLLHEIGHNFTPTTERGARVICAFPGLMQIFATIAYILDGITKEVVGNRKVNWITLPSITGFIIARIIMQSNSSRKGLSNFDKGLTKIMNKLKKDNPAVVTVIGAGSFISALKNEILNSLDYLEKLVDYLDKPNYANIPLNLILSMVRSIMKPFGYADEKFADSFPRMYGYGEELITGLEKMSNESDTAAQYVVNKTPLRILEVAHSIYLLPYTVIFSTFDEHPTNLDRAQFMVKDLQKELNDPANTLSPATKKQMMQDAEDIQKAYDEYIKNMNSLDAHSRGLGRNIWQMTMSKVFGGTLKSKIKGTHVNDDINAFFDDLD
jgi:hypothetical protein